MAAECGLGFRLEGKLYLSYCLKGLQNIEKLTHTHCEVEEFSFPKLAETFGITEITKLHIQDQTKMINCDYLYGELYVYYSCTSRCSDSVCPLTKPIRYDSCSRQFPDRVYTLVNNEYLTFVTKLHGSYQNNYFSCDNNYCITYDKVCNLVDDCGDGSDEKLCINHFQCESTKTFIAKTSQCNGAIDCNDLSDECNSECGKQIIEETYMKGLSWTIGGFAVLLNFIVIVQNTKVLKNCTSSIALLNKLLIMMISIGDFLVGGYLLTISIVDQWYGSEYCASQTEWLTSPYCSILGIVSTVGSQISLFSMTIFL